MGYSEPEEPAGNQHSPDFQEGGFLPNPQVKPGRSVLEPGNKTTPSETSDIPGSIKLFREGPTPVGLDDSLGYLPTQTSQNQPNQADKTDSPVATAKPEPSSASSTTNSPVINRTAKPVPTHTGSGNTPGRIDGLNRPAKGQRTGSTGANTATVPAEGQAFPPSDFTGNRSLSPSQPLPNPSSQPGPGLLSRAKQAVGLGKKQTPVETGSAAAVTESSNIPARANGAVEPTKTISKEKGPAGLSNNLINRGKAAVSNRLAKNETINKTKAAAKKVADAGKDAAKLFASGGTDIRAWARLTKKYWQPVVSVLSIAIIGFGLIFGLALSSLIPKSKAGRIPPSQFSITDTAAAMVPGVNSEFEEIKMLACEDGTDDLDLTDEEKQKIASLCAGAIPAVRNHIIQKGSDYLFVRDDPETYSAATTAVNPIPGAPTTLNFNPNFIIHDLFLTDKNAMSLEDIQRFLIRKKSPLATLSPDRLGPNTNGRSAAKVIYDYTRGRTVTAVVNGRSYTSTISLNPMVILTMIQKEQSLVTRKEGADYQRHLDRAAGCGVYHSRFDEIFKGYTQQIQCLTYNVYKKWLAIKNGYTYTGNGNAYRVGGTGVFERGTRVTFTNAATAELFFYNPELSGNRNFHRILIQFFSPQIKQRYAAANNRSLTDPARKREGSVTIRAAQFDGVPLIFQNSYAHVDYPKPNGQSRNSAGQKFTLATSGCAIVSTSMILDYYDLDHSDPETLACLALGKRSENCNNKTPVTGQIFRDSVNGTKDSWFPFIAQKNGLRYEQLGGRGTPIKWDKIIENLNNRRPVIVSGKKGGLSCNDSPFTKGGHFVVLTGVNADGSIRVNNSLRSTSSCNRLGRSYTLDSLKNTAHFAFVMYKP